MRTTIYIIPVVLCLFVSASSFAEDYSFTPQKAIAAQSTDDVEDIDAVANDSGWDVFLSMRNGNLVVVQLDATGKVLGRKILLKGEQVDGGNSWGKIRAAWGGDTWGLVVEEHTWEQIGTGWTGETDYVFYCFKSGNGKQVGKAIPVTGFAGGVPLWMDTYYLVLYGDGYGAKGYSRGFNCMKVGDNGKMIGKQKVIKASANSADGLRVVDAIVRGGGVVILYYIENYTAGTKYSGYALMNLNNKLVGVPKKLANVSAPFLSKRILWTGSHYIVSGRLYNAANKCYFAAVGLAGEAGAWVRSPETRGDFYNKSDEAVDLGITYGNGWYYQFFDDERYNRGRFWGTTFDQKSRMGPVDFFNYGWYSEGLALHNGTTTSLFLVNKWGVKDGNKQTIKGDAYFKQFIIAHNGKPALVYLEGQIHEEKDQRTALVSWRFDGVDTVFVKIKGRKATLPAEGFLAWETTADSVAFKFKAKNKSGKLNQKITVQ